MDVATGLHAEREFTVGPDDTAVAVGSGSLPVLGTPRLLAWCEAVTCAALDGVLPEGDTSVGTRVSLAHQAPSRVGARLRVRATVVHVEGRKVRFAVRAAHDDGSEVASGEVTRAVVEAAKFLERIP